jgi:uncharacterized UBP type Zn finger protein
MVEIIAITPKRDCPHCVIENIAQIEEFTAKTRGDPCFECQSCGENWICLRPGCGTVACSRYVNSHMAKTHHANNADHPIVFSFADCSFWCYECDSYIEHILLQKIKKFFDKQDAPPIPVAPVSQPEDLLPIEPPKPI